MARLSFLILAAFVAPASAGPCAIPMVSATVTTPPGSTILFGGGVLVTLGFGGYGGNQKPQGLEQKGWRFKVGTKLVAPVIKTLGPGLAVYEVPGEGEAMTLVDDNQKELVAVTRDANPGSFPIPGAPNVKSIVHSTIVSRGPRGGSDSRMISVQLASKPPITAVAMILYPAGNTSTAVSWVSIMPTPSALEHVVYASGGRCSIQIPGMMEVPVGSRASIAWVDHSGRVSPRSKEFVVVKGKPPANTLGP